MHSKEQANKIYGICVAKAKAGKTLTYREMLDSIGYGPRVRGNAIRYGLELISVACAYSKLPNLTSIIVEDATGQPSTGYHPENLKNDQQMVFNHQEWHAVDNIDWDHVWENRIKLSDKHGTRNYWTNRQSGDRQGKGLDRHNERVGNRGDVWKHFILCGVADTLLQARSDKQPFVYADTHCSLGRFDLIENGQWRQGIGKFYDRPLPDYPYFAMEQEAYKTCNQYLGSWKLVERLLADRKIQGDLQLFDTSEEVYLQLRKMGGFHHSDGFEAINSGLLANLYFVDPAYSEDRESDWKRVIEGIKKFCEGGARALIWYPVFVKKRPIEDLPGVVIAKVQWSARGANQEMRGCGMVATGATSTILLEMQKSLTQLAEALSGNLCLLDKRS